MSGGIAIAVCAIEKKLKLFFTLANIE